MTPVHISGIVALTCGLVTLAAAYSAGKDMTEEFCLGLSIICGIGFLVSIGAMIAFMIMGGSL